MKKLRYYVLDVFSSQKFKGNQLSVVWSDEELEPGQYYAIAREFGYSETSFVHYSELEQVFKVRSFTPGNYEVLGAGHNLLGAVCLAILKDWDVFRAQKDERWVYIADQKIPLEVSTEDGLPFVAMKQKPATFHAKVPAAVIAAALGLAPEAIVLNNWEPVVAKTEVAHLMVPVKNSVYLKQAVPDNTLLQLASEKYGFEGCYLFTTVHDQAGYMAETRFFNPGIGIHEDAATGTAAGPLAGYLHHKNYIEPERNYLILQGVHLEHPSTIRANVSSDGIWISGSSVLVMEGVLYL